MHPSNKKKTEVLSTSMDKTSAYKWKTLVVRLFHPDDNTKRQIANQAVSNNISATSESLLIQSNLPAIFTSIEIAVFVSELWFDVESK